MDKKDNTMTAEERKLMLIDYQKSQDSAQHYESVAWTVTSVSWAACLVLLGFILSALDEPPNKLLITMLSIIGLLLTIGEWFQHQNFQNVKKTEISKM